MKWGHSHFITVFPADFSHQISHKHRAQIFVVSGIQYRSGMNSINIHCGRVQKNFKAKLVNVKLPFARSGSFGKQY